MNGDIVKRYFIKWFSENFCREPNLEIDMDQKLYLSFLAGIEISRHEH